ncbi:hypothetical protein VTO42DRAFT_2216 [Malbranchea cinnamomea]
MTNVRDVLRGWRARRAVYRAHGEFLSQAPSQRKEEIIAAQGAVAGRFMFGRLKGWAARPMPGSGLVRTPAESPIWHHSLLRSPTARRCRSSSLLFFFFLLLSLLSLSSLLLLLPPRRPLISSDQKRLISSWTGSPLPLPPISTVYHLATRQPRLHAPLAPSFPLVSESIVLVSPQLLWTAAG